MEIIAKFDTVAKTLTVTQDGKAIANVADVQMNRSYSEDDKFGCCVTTAMRDEDNDCWSMTRLVAQEHKMVEVSKLHDSIAKFFNRG